MEWTKMNWNEVKGAGKKYSKLDLIIVMKSSIISKNLIEIAVPTLACLHMALHVDWMFHIPMRLLRRLLFVWFWLFCFSSSFTSSVLKSTWNKQQKHQTELNDFNTNQIDRINVDNKNSIRKHWNQCIISIHF